jgi:hypothetical protein
MNYATIKCHFIVGLIAQFANSIVFRVGPFVKKISHPLPRSNNEIGTKKKNECVIEHANNNFGNFRIVN